MNVRTKLFLPGLLLLAACGADHPLAGNWSLESGADAKGTALTFDGNSDKVSVHLATREDGSHGHAPMGSYTFDEKTNAVTVKALILGEGKAEQWAGKLDGEHLELSAGDTHLKFHKGGDPHGH